MNLRSAEKGLRIWLRVEVVTSTDSRKMSLNVERAPFMCHLFVVNISYQSAIAMPRKSAYQFGNPTATNEGLRFGIYNFSNHQPQSN